MDDFNRVIGSRLQDSNKLQDTWAISLSDGPIAEQKSGADVDLEPLGL